MEHEGQVIAQSGRELLELEAEQASVDSELEDVVGHDNDKTDDKPP